MNLAMAKWEVYRSSSTAARIGCRSCVGRHALNYKDSYIVVGVAILLLLGEGRKRLLSAVRSPAVRVDRAKAEAGKRG